jgi:hypothetical protein
MLTRADEWPVHQTPEPIAFAGTDRNFYDRYFFCGYRSDGSDYFALAFGVYPALNVADAHLSILGADGVQRCLHASRILNMERMDLQVGPIRIEVIEPLSRLRIVVDDHERLSADLVCVGRSAPVTEPRFIRRNGSRTLMDVTRFTQNVRWEGWISVDGARETYAAGDALGTRDRSWGVRPIGAQDPQPNVPTVPPQFHWLWTPTNFPDLSLYFHLNEDAAGVAWNTRCALAIDGAPQGAAFHLHDTRARPVWRSGTRHAQSLTLTGRDGLGREHQVVWTPFRTFFMKGIGYGHPDWAHGGWKGDLAVAREDFDVNGLDPMAPHHLHVQALARARHEGPDGLGSDGIGIVEQLTIGPHAPSGFKDILDPAA